MDATELGSLLANAKKAGTYFVDIRDREALIEGANALGWDVRPVELLGCRDRAAGFEAIADALRFPDWFGGNWDALADCLRDLEWLPAKGYLLLFEHADAWRDAAPDEFKLLLEILDEAARDWSSRDVALWSLFPVPRQQLDALQG